MTNSGHIFISYKTEQRSLAFSVRDKLREWGYETWLDVDRLQPGTYWANDIDVALKSCRACIGVMTPQSIRSRYVTNEWDMAIMKGKLFVPLMFERTEPHYKYIDIQYIDFTPDPKDSAYDLLKSRLDGHNPASDNKPPDDPYYDYLQQLYDRINRYLSAKLITSLRDDEGKPEPIRLSSARVDGAVDALFAKREEIDPLFAFGGIADELPQEFEDFSEAIDYFDGRVLLLGEPGAGKTVTLLQYARDAVVKRRQDMTAPLPILGIIPSWDLYESKTVIEWLQSAFGSPYNTARIIENGEALLLLDGLDELGGSSPQDPEFDPRKRFIESMPANGSILVTSRERDYQSIAKKLPLNGAITLKPLNTQQLNKYLDSNQKLESFIAREPRIREWLSNPMLLSFFAFTFEEMNALELETFVSSEHRGEIRDKIIGAYVRQRFAHERPKLQRIGADISLDDLNEALRVIAFASVGGLGYWHYCKDGWKDKLQEINLPEGFLRRGGMISRDLVKELGVSDSVVDLSVKMQLLIEEDNKLRFIHALVRDYYAYLAIEHERALPNKGTWCIGELFLSIGAIADDRHWAILSALAHEPFFKGEYGADLAESIGKFGSVEAATKLGHLLRTQKGHDQLMAYWSLLDMGEGGETALIESANALIHGDDDAMTSQVLSLTKLSNPENDEIWQDLRRKWAARKG